MTNKEEESKYRYPLRDISITDKDGNQEIVGTEVNHLLGARSWDDNWEPTGIYTSEVRDDKDRFYAFIDFHGDEGNIKYCPHCLEYGIQNKLKPRILKKGEVKPPDYDMFAQCYECGNISPIYEAVQEPEIKDSEETIDNPFENESVFMSSKKRKYKDRRLNSLLDDDSDIAGRTEKTWF